MPEKRSGKERHKQREKENSEKDSQAYPKKIESLNRQVVLLQKELDEARSNDATIEKVLRIMKERANKDRGIKGKKDNPGYELISSERYFYSTSKTQGFDMYKTLIQTPFPSELNRSQVIELWKYDDDRCDWFESIGIGVQFDIGNNASYYFFNITKQLEERSDIYISTAFKRNFKTGYWEATIIHNEEIEL